MWYKYIIKLKMSDTDEEMRNDYIMEYMDQILDLAEEDKIIGIIYKMTNTITNKCYVGQTRSHRKNNNKYRPFGFIGRFNEHLSEAFTNIKKDQSVYLNNSIRKHGKDAFTVKLIETCELNELNDRETYFIKELNTLFPNGYNLKEGTEFSKKPVENNAELRIPTKRGREFGYKHKEETKSKMKKYYETETGVKVIEKKKETMQKTIASHFANKRAETLANSDIKLDENFADLIRPQKKDGEIVSYVIRYKRKKYSRLCGKQYTPDDVYKNLYDALKEAYEIQKNRTTKTS